MLSLQSLQLLKEAIFEDECTPLFSLEIYGHIIGMFELNNLDLVVASPVEDYFIHIDDLPSPEKVKTSTHTFHIKKKREKKNLQSSSLAGDFFSPCGEKKRLPAWGEETWRHCHVIYVLLSCPGTGFYPLQSCMNHSCCPNAKAFKGDEVKNWHSLQDKDGRAIIIAARPIVKGEENPLLDLVGFCQCGKPDALDLNFCRLLFRISMRISLTMRDRPFLPITALDACAKGAWRRYPECELEREKRKVYMVGNQQIVESMVGGSLIPFQCF
ncbi:hypothetical protein B296_00009307 [Ensete ventricosum]|uniref:SET domain-containing protein n=1 Tax=Ensete ventricosum TaxID=4639 RepID=A0A427AZU6_ENSVE|nr:hypothetical protein B296_00009307 [Ensete ventricosum]